MAGVTLFSPPITNQAKLAVESREGGRSQKASEKKRAGDYLYLLFTGVCVCAVIIHYVKIKEGGFETSEVYLITCNVLGWACCNCDIS